MATGMPAKQKRDSLSSGGLDTERFTFTFSIDVSSQIETCLTNETGFVSNGGIMNVLKMRHNKTKQARPMKRRVCIFRCYMEADKNKGYL